MVLPLLVLAAVSVVLVEDSPVASAVDSAAILVLLPVTSAVVPTTSLVTARLRL